jgi:hypothetical protein
VIASAVTGPDPVPPGGQRLGPGQVPGGAGQLVPHHVQPGLQRVDHLQRGGDLQLPGRGQAAGCCGPQFGHALPGAQRALGQYRGAPVEQHRVDPLRPGGALAAQVGVQLRAEHRTAALDLLHGRDPATRYLRQLPSASTFLPAAVRLRRLRCPPR